MNKTNKMPEMPEMKAMRTLFNTFCERVEAIIEDSKNKELEKEEKEKRWKPKNDEMFYYAMADRGSSRMCLRENYGYQFIEIGNYYRTEGDLEKQTNKLKAIERVKDYIDENFGLFLPDWKDSDVEKITILYDPLNDCLEIDALYCCKTFSPIGYLKSEEDYARLVKDCEEDLLLIYRD